MSNIDTGVGSAFHSHVFLGEGHASAEGRTWAVIWLCGAMMAAEIIGGWLFGSIALIADGLHMSTHAGALLLAALAYTFARRHAHDTRFTFGTGKFGDLAGFTSAIVLALIALLIGYEAVSRIVAPVPIRFAEAIPIAALGLAVNVASVWLLGGGHHHGHDHRYEGRHAGHPHDETRRIAARGGDVVLEIFEDGVPPRFRLRPAPETTLAPDNVRLVTVRPDGARQAFAFVAHSEFLESVETIPEPHEFRVEATIDGETRVVLFKEHEHARGAAARDNNMRAAIVHVVADATVSVLVIVGLLLAWAFGWPWVDPLIGVLGALVIMSWSFALIRDTSVVLLDVNPDTRMTETIRNAIESEGDAIADLHVWRLGPGHLGAIVSIVTPTDRREAFYRAKLGRFRALSHLTIEVRQAAPATA